MRSQPAPNCPLCGTLGIAAYERMNDRLFGAAGQWSLSRCTNNDCGLLWLSPMPIPEDIGMAYQTYYTHGDEAPRETRFRRFLGAGMERYVASRYGYPTGGGIYGLAASLMVRADPGWRANAEFSAFYLPAREGGRLLEVGCGSGRMLLAMRNRGWDVTGLDPDPQAVANARSHGLDVREGGLRSQDFAENTFDAVAMSHVVEHLHDPSGVIKDCLRVLRPGGRLVLVTPNTASFGLRAMGWHWMHLDPPRHLHLFNATTLTRLVCDAGFSGVIWHTAPRDAKTCYGISMMIRRQGRWRMGAPLPVSTRIAGRMLEFVESVILMLFPDKGTELVVIGRKPWDS